MAMRKKPWAIYVWPGLPHIWMRGSWSALGVAIIAAVLICAVILGSFGWTELITPGVRNTLWGSLVLVWCIAGIVSAVKLRHDAAKDETGKCENPFGQAVDLYLKGDYYQVERVLNSLLVENPRDLEASLMLATVLRHTGRFDEASRQLDQLICFDGAEKWELEIETERELVSAYVKNMRVQPKQEITSPSP
jgi:hypothetical protein